MKYKPNGQPDTPNANGCRRYVTILSNLVYIAGIDAAKHSLSSLDARNAQQTDTGWISSAIYLQRRPKAPSSLSSLPGGDTVEG